MFFIFGLLFFILAKAGMAAPIISNHEIVSIGEDFAIITWQTTNEPSLGEIKYGASLPVSNTTRETGNPRESHYLVIRDLYPNTTYHYKIISHASSGTTEGSVKSFKTLERPSGNLLLTFAMLSDLHYAPNQDNLISVRGRPYNSSEAIVDALVANINRFNPAFTIIKGDMLDSDTNFPATRVNELKVRLDNLTAWGPTKYYPIPGNHDKSLTYGGALNWVTGNLGILYPPGNSLPAGDSTFNYGFTYNGVRFIMLDSSRADGTIAEVNIASLEAELEIARTGKMKAFIFMHHEASEEADIPNEILANVLAQATFNPATDWDKIRIRNKGAFLDKLKTYKLDNGEPVVAAVYMGHIHDNRRREFEGIPFIRTSSGLQFPTGFTIIKVYSNGFTQSFFKLPTFSDPIARHCITGSGPEITKARAEQFYLGGLSDRNFTQTFSALTTIIPPTVAAVQPAAGATGVALNQPIIINFTKAMTKETRVHEWLTISDVTLSPNLWRWNADKTQLTLTPPLTASKTYTVTILGGLGNATATDGTFFPANYSFSFTTGTSSSTTPPSAFIHPIKNEAGAETNVTTDPTPTFLGIATDESGSTIAKVEFRYQSPSWSRWYPATPADGAFNAATEPFTFTITPELPVGEHRVQVRTTNAAGVTMVEGFTPYVFYLISEKPLITLQADGSELTNGDPINPSPSLKITVVTDQTLDQLWFAINNETPVNIKPSPVTYVNHVSYRPTLTDGSHNLRVQAVDRDSLGNTRTSTTEVVNLMVQTTGDLRVYGTPLNYPNPFNAGTESTTFSYVLSRNSPVTLSVFDLSGTLVAKREAPAGTNGGRAGYNDGIAWDGRSDAGEIVGNGIYVYLILAEGKVVARGKVTVLKR